jgi:hypothetical protein
MTAPSKTTTWPSMSEDTGGIYADNGAFVTDGAGNVTAGNVTPTGTITLGNAKFLKGTKSDNITVQNLVGLDNANNTQVQAVVGQHVKLGDGTTTFWDVTAAAVTSAVAATTNKWTDGNANQINSGGSKISASANGAVAHGYAGTLTPTLINTMLGTAGTVIWGTIGTANATITMSAAGAFIAQALLV